MKVLVLVLAFMLTACVPVREPEARVTVQARQAVEGCHVTARAEGDLVLFEATNCEEGEIVRVRVHATWGVVMDGGVMGGGDTVPWWPRQGEFIAVEVESGRVIADVSAR